MAEVLFYHLTESTLEDALPGLLERSLGRGWRVAVQTGTEERRDALDAHLWTFRDDSFLAHATDREPYPAEQPVLLTT
ncbi:MAG: DNA polymerase III subunit chi, partial [Mesorhizobium sp.]|nr:DNA polymerase III subunit chi [Mesorhizobium sp.]